MVLPGTGRTTLGVNDETAILDELIGNRNGLLQVAAAVVPEVQNQLPGPGLREVVEGPA